MPSKQNSDFPIDELRRIFESAIEIDAGCREHWLSENVADIEVRTIIARLLATEGRAGILDMSLPRFLDAIGVT